MIKTRNGLEQGSVRNLLYFLCALPVWAITAGVTETSRDPETGLESWQVETRGIQVRLTQISPDQARAFYQARGFTPEQAEDYASSCVFMTVVRNIGTLPIEHRLADSRDPDLSRGGLESGHDNLPASARQPLQPDRQLARG